VKFRTVFALFFASVLAGAGFQLFLHPELRDGAVTFTPDWSRIPDLLQGPGRVLGHWPWLFLIDAGILAAVVAVFLSRDADGGGL
jgi:type II secretory pathway component PulF